jgi:hypothetical protein
MRHLIRTGCTAATLLSAMAFAQGVNSGPTLKQACETSPGNIVQLLQPTKIEYGPASVVFTACTIQLSPGASLEVKQVNMTFAGPLTIYGAYQNKVVFEEALWSAASLHVTANSSGEIIAKDSRLQATAGDISINQNPYGKMELIGNIAPNPNVLEASGAITISSGIYASVVLEDASVQAGSGILVSPGTRSNMKASKANFSVTTGSVSLAAGMNTKLELKESVLTSPATVNVSTGDGGHTIVEEAQLDGATGVTILSGVASPDSGASTLVKNSRGTSTGLVSVQTGARGVCLSDNNAFTAPLVRLCN